MSFKDLTADRPDRADAFTRRRVVGPQTRLARKAHEPAEFTAAGRRFVVAFDVPTLARLVAAGFELWAGARACRGVPSGVSSPPVGSTGRATRVAVE
jgi:hypothetical protein